MSTTSKNVCSYAAITGKNAKSVDQLIDAAISSAKTMREKAQVAAVAVLMHAEKHGDYSKANVLVEGMGQGVQASALVKWFVEFGGLVVDNVEDAEGKTKKAFTGWKGKDYIRANFEKAKTTAWWSFHKADPFKGFDFASELGKLLARADKAMSKIDDAAKAGDEAEKERLLEVVSIDADMLRAVAQLVKAA